MGWNARQVGEFCPVSKTIRSVSCNWLTGAQPALRGERLESCASIPSSARSRSLPRSRTQSIILQVLLCNAAARRDSDRLCEKTNKLAKSEFYGRRRILVGYERGGICHHSGSIVSHDRNPETKQRKRNIQKPILTSPSQTPGVNGRIDYKTIEKERHCPSN